MFIFIFLLLICILALYIISFFKKGKIIKSSNAIYIIPVTIIIFYMYLYVVAKNNIKLGFFEFFSYLRIAIETFTLQYDEVIFLGFDNLFFKIDFYLAFTMALFTTITVALAFIINSIKLFITLNYYRIVGFDCIIGNSSNELEYVKNNKRALLWALDDYEELKKDYIFIKYQINSNSFKKICKKAHKRINFIYPGSNQNLALEIVNEFNKFIIDNNLSREDIYLYVNGNKELSSIINRNYQIKDDTSPRIIMFNKYDLIAKKFIIENPYTKFMGNKFIDYNTATIFDDLNLNNIFIGFGNVNQELYLKMFSNNQFLTINNNQIKVKNVNYYAFDRKENIDSLDFNHNILRFNKCIYNDSYFEFPEKNHIVFKKIDINDINFYSELSNLLIKKSFTNIVISISDDINNLNLAYKINELLIENRIEDYHIYVKLNNTLDNILFDDVITPFGDINSLLSHDVIVNDQISQLAKIRSNKYFLSKSPNDLAKAYSKWNMLDSIKRESNIACALSIFIKLNLIGLEVSLDCNDKCISKEEFNSILRINKNYDYSKYNFNEITPANILGIIEHHRWNAFYISKGYVPHKKEDIQIRIDNKLNIIKDNPIERTHACITSIYGLDCYHRYLAEKIFDLDKEHKLYKTYDECLNDIETFKYDLDFMNTIYDDLISVGYKIIRRSDKKKD